MRARVKYNNEIIDVVQVGTKTHLFDLNNVEFLDNTPDYWTRLEHQYAGMAMQGILSNEDYLQSFSEDARGNLFEDIARVAEDIAHALVEKMKNQSV